MDVSIPIEIHTYDNKLVFDLLEKSSVSQEDEIQICDHARMKYTGSYIKKAVGFPEIVYLVLTFGASVSASLIANWLYEKIRGKKIEKLIIERTEIEVKQDAITKVLKEKIEVRRK
jgi:hypothetical protein